MRCIDTRLFQLRPLVYFGPALALVLALAGCTSTGDSTDSGAGPGAGQGTGPGGAAGAGGAGSGPQAGQGGASSTGGGAGTGGGETSIPSACKLASPEAQVTTTGAEGVAMLWDNDHYLLAFTDTAQGGAIAVATMTAAGQISSGPTQVEPGSGKAKTPALAKASSGYVVAWEDVGGAPNVHIHALDGAAMPTGSSSIIPSSGAVLVEDGQPESRPSLAASPSGVAVAWMDTTDGVPSAFVTWLDASAKPSSSAPARLGQTSAGASFPALGGGGAGELGVVWSDARDGKYDLRFARATTSGMSGDEPVRSAQSNAFLGRLIRAGDGYVAAWEDTRSGSTEVYMGLLDGSGAKTYEGVVEAGKGDANWPSLAWTGSSTAVVYYQFRGDGQPKIFLTLIDPGGARVAGGGDLQVSESPKGSKARFPTVQWTGSELGVAWIDAREGDHQIRFARVTCH